MAMKADATLVNAAFREGQTGAMADVPSMKPLFEGAARIQKTYMDTITGIMKTLEEKKEQKEAAKVQGLKPVKETIQKAYNALSDGEPLPGFVVDDFTGQIEALQDSFEKVNTEGKGDTRANEKERRRIMAALARLKNQAIDVRSKYMIAFQDPSSYNDPLIKGEDIDAFNSIAMAFSDPAAAAEMFKNGNLRGEFVNGEYTIFTKGYSTGKRLAGDAGFIEGSENEEGMPEIDYDSETEEEYKYGKERGFTGSDMVKALPYKNPASDIAVGEFLKEAPRAGKADGANGTANRYRDNPNARNTEIAEALDFIKTDEDYHDMKSRRLEGTGMAPSFDQALGGMAAIPIEVLNNMFLDAKGSPVTDIATYFAELDQKGNKDGKINSGDFPEDGDALKTFMNNIETVKEEILNNKEIGAPMMAEYFADMKIKAYNDNYDANTKTPAHLVLGSTARNNYLKELKGQNPNINDGTKTETNPYGLSLSKKGKYGLGLPSKGTSYVPQYDATYVTNKIDSLKNGSEISFQGSNYTFREVDGKTQWWKDYGYGDDYGVKVEGVGIGKPIGTAQDMARDVFYVVDDPVFGNIVTEREQEIPDDITGLLPSDNQFADRQAVAEGQGKAAVVPTDFVDAFSKNIGSDLAVVKHLRNMNVPGLVVGTYQGHSGYNYPDNDNRKLVKESDTAYDDIILTINGKTKLFTTDPSFSDDTEGAQEIWNWLYENFSGNNDKVEW